MDLSTEDLVARQRLALLQLAERLDNVSEACRRLGFSRTQFYVYKQRFQESGMDGLKDLPPIPHSHPHATSTELVKRILELSLDHPSWGCDRLSAQLEEEGESISAQTVQNILNREEMGTKRDRWLILEQRQREEDADLSGEQIVFLEKQNPAYRDRHRKGDYPGELVTQFAVMVGKLVGSGIVYVHAAVDTFSNYAFARLYSSKRPEAAVNLLREDVLPFYGKLNLRFEAVLTNNGREYCGGESHPFESFLEENDIEHLHTRQKKRHTSGFLQRFRTIMLNEFFNEVFGARFYQSIEDLQVDLDEWLAYYNTSRPHLGYPNMGWVPFEKIKAYIDEVGAGDLTVESRVKNSSWVDAALNREGIRGTR
jgi:transposase InsO family protein